MSKPVLCLDFDGVLHSHISGWKGYDVIPDPPVEGALEFIGEVLSSGDWELHIFSSRSMVPEGIKAMQDWLITHLNGKYGHSAQFEKDVRLLIKWPTDKPPALVTLDDRAIRFNGTFPDLGQLKSFKTWQGK